ncbi:MAG: UDP-N-acetylmuramoyl-tripeptide--D-alanyl-D-alanine ligase, partial [Cyanobacteria bacterium P01_D01_bin.2]
DPAEAEALAAGARDTPHQRFADHGALTRHLEQMIQPGDRLLFKASRSVAMDQVVAPLLRR